MRFLLPEQNYFVTLANRIDLKSEHPCRLLYFISQFYSLVMNIHNSNLLQIIYSVYLKIHLFSLIDMHVLHLYIIQYFQCWFKNKEPNKTNFEKHDADFWPKTGHIQILQNSTFILGTVSIFLRCYLLSCTC